MQQYEITLKNKKIRSYHLFAWLIAFIIYAFEVYLALVDSTKIEERLWIFPFIGICIIFLLINKGFSLETWGKKEYVGTAYVFLILPLIKWHLYWAILLLIAIYFLYAIACRKFQLLVSKKNVLFPSYPAKKIEWKDLSNVILKDELLTIDFKNNKLLQSEADLHYSFNEKEFNDFCSEQLRKAGSSI